LNFERFNTPQEPGTYDIYLRMYDDKGTEYYNDVTSFVVKEETQFGSNSIVQYLGNGVYRFELELTNFNNLDQPLYI